MNLPPDPRDHAWFTADGDLIASRLTEYDALRVARRCAERFGQTYIVRGPLFRTVVEPDRPQLSEMRLA